MKRLFEMGVQRDVQLLGGEIGMSRGTYEDAAGDVDRRVLLAFPVSDNPARATLDRLTHEYHLRSVLDGAWALLPIDLKRVRGSTVLVLEDPGGELLVGRVDRPVEIDCFLALASKMAAALGGVHARGLIHRDVKPSSIMVGSVDGSVRFTGFGLASRLVRERQEPAPPETIGGTLAYMSPEQSGRTNRSVDTRSDLYSLGVTFYEMVTGVLPFTATDPMELVHSHIAKRPVPPCERLAAVPEMVSAIIMKLLEKTPEERYQTASGLMRDLDRCSVAWAASGRIDPFELGLHDCRGRLLIPERLYGREREHGIAMACLARVVASEGPELMLVSGYSGIGKSAVVEELRKAQSRPQALFASGKFDQNQREDPYATLVQALQGLVRLLLGKTETELAEWRNVFLQVLGPNGRLITDLIPELRLVVGDQPRPAELPPLQARVRFQSLLQRVVGVFARPEHPLILFLDDLQWVDVATLDLLEDMLTRSELANLLLIGAYRDNEVGEGHLLRRKLGAIKSAGGRVTEVALGPMSRDHVAEMISDALESGTEDVATLAELVHDKTEGNPFFVVEFLLSLAENDLLTFSHEFGRWSWDVGRIEAQQYTANVVDLMVDKLARLPGDTQAALRELSCLGNAADVETLALVLEAGAAEVDATMFPARRLELVQRTPNGYRFTHDRVQEAAYSMLSDTLRAAAHLRIGRLLARNVPAGGRDPAILDVVNQLNRAAALIDSPEERAELAELNLVAGKRAKASAAYAAALSYFAAGAAMLGDGDWERRRDLAFALELQVAECEFLTGLPVQADERLAALRHRVADLTELSAVVRLRGEIFVTLNQPRDAVDVGLEFLRQIGTNWSAHPTRQNVEDEHAELRRRLAARPIASLGDLPPIEDEAALATMEVLLQLAPAAVATNDNLLCVIVCRMGILSLDHGGNDGSCAAYVWLGMVLGPYLGDYRSGFEFGQLGLELVERQGLERFRVRAYMLFGAHVNPWTRHVREGRPMLQRAFNEANQVGDVIFAGFSCCNLITILLAAGDDLEAVQREVEFGLEYARDHQFSFVADLMAPQLQLVRTLRGTLPTLGRFDGGGFSEVEFERRIETLPVAGCFYWVRKLQSRFLSGDHAEALDAAARAEPLLWTSTASLELAEYHFFAALARAALHGDADGVARSVHMDALLAHRERLEGWTRNCQVNFENRSTLVGAEIARIEGRIPEAMRLYERSIQAAGEHGFVHHQALANELAARFYRDEGFETIARAYLREAREGYLRWGAVGKVEQLDLIMQNVRGPAQASGPGTHSTSLVESLDLATVIRVAQEISGETALDRLIDTLMRTAMEHAGGEKAVLLLMEDGGHRIEAHALIDADGLVVHSRHEVAPEASVPHSVLRYVARVRESVILEDALAPNTFSDDPYFDRNDVRSLLCLPLINRTQLIGLLYIENNLAPRVFTSERLAVLKLIALQAAISLENARLYHGIEERESKIRRLVESDVIGIVIWDLDGNLIDANDAFLSMLQYDRSDLEAGLRWFDMTPPEWQNVHLEEEAEELKATGAMRAREKEYYRKDGTRVPILIGAAVFETQSDQGVAYILDLTDLKRAEFEARENERRYREAQLELAHANRTSTLGQLTGSIAHEVNQPITATVTNAQAGLRELQSGSPDMVEIREVLESIVKDGIRAGNIIARIRGLIKKSPSTEEELEINDPIREVMELMRGEADRNSVTVRLELSDALPAVRGDKVQLQQVILNLIMNAVEAMSLEHGGPRELLITTGQAADGDVVVTVKDSGPGLAPDAEEEAFEAFYTTKEMGLGMGLSICRSIIEAHGGRIWAGANGEGGAFLRFTLPEAGGADLSAAVPSPAG